MYQASPSLSGIFDQGVKISKSVGWLVSSYLLNMMRPGLFALLMTTASAFLRPPVREPAGLVKRFGLLKGIDPNLSADLLKVSFLKI